MLLFFKLKITKFNKEKKCSIFFKTIINYMLKNKIKTLIKVLMKLKIKF